MREQTRARWTPPRKLTDGSKIGTLDVLKMAWDMHRATDTPLLSALLGVSLMAWTDPTTRSTSDLITAAIWNTDLVDNLTYLHDELPSARVYHSTSQSCTGSTDTALAFDSERFDTDGIHSVVSNTERLTCQTDGVYFIWGNAEWTTSAGTYYLKIRLNGSTMIAMQRHDGSANNPGQVCCIYELAATDYVELIANPSGTRSVGASGNYSPEFGMHRIG